MSKKQYYIPGVDAVNQLVETPASKERTEKKSFCREYGYLCDFRLGCRCRCRGFRSLAHLEVTPGTFRKHTGRCHFYLFRNWPRQSARNVPHSHLDIQQIFHPFI